MTAWWQGTIKLWTVFIKKWGYRIVKIYRIVKNYRPELCCKIPADFVNRLKPRLN